MPCAGTDDLLAALGLPEDSRVDRRVPKKLLIEHGAPTAADKRRIAEGIEELHWVAALKPSSVGVPEYRDSTRAYLEIAVLRLTLRPEAKTARLGELVHRAVPYPVLLFSEQGSRGMLSAAHIRWAKNEADKMVLEDEVTTVAWEDRPEDAPWRAFRLAMALERQPRASMYALYQGWLDTMLALQAARLTGAFTGSPSPEDAAARRTALHECARLEAGIARLRAAAANERQIARQVELNLELKRAEAQLTPISALGVPS